MRWESSKSQETNAIMDIPECYIYNIKLEKNSVMLYVHIETPWET